MSEITAAQIYHHAGHVTPADRRALLKQTGATLWFTGLSGSGKSTLAVALEQALIARGHAAYVLDGDNVRFGLNASPKILMETRGYAEEPAKRFGLGFSAADRVENIRRIGEVTRLFADAGLLTLTSFVSPYRKDRDAVRALHTQNKGYAIPFIEVYVNTPIECCEQRDPKGLYKQAREAVVAGKAMGFTGVDDPYEPPLAPELTFDASKHPVEEGAALVLNYLIAKGLVG
ncbi:MAG: adenylyl-sulfate kinase [Planctomycetaceae bacterium]|nr:adenylyl-sulfate kinase [Planctomycetaceae bacterium]